jgi:hypothetical protein
VKPASPHSDRAHAKLSPSSASRWMQCPGSVRLSAGIADKSSVFADEGTAAHMLAERCLRHELRAEHAAGFYVDITRTRGLLFADEPGDGRFFVDDEMVDGVQMYLDHVRGLFSICDEHAIEQRLSLAHVHPDIFGTGDAVGYVMATDHLHVVDFKYGRGVAVEPNMNPQLLCYGAGALHAFETSGHKVRNITLHIVQPRAPHPNGPIRKCVVMRSAMSMWEVDLKLAALATEAKDAPLSAGEHCRFCRAAAVCPERRRASLDAAGAEFTDKGALIVQPVQELTPVSMGRLLSEIDQIEAWCRRVREHAHMEATHGRLPEGWKLVAKRAYRKWKDEEAAADALRAKGLEDEDIYARKLMSPAAADKLLKSDAKSLVSLVSKESSGTVLAPLEDTRPAVLADPAIEFGEH